MGHLRGEYDTEAGCMAELEEPPMYRVLLLNDDYTPMDFVVDILRTVFHKSPAEAERIMLNVHEKGSGLCGIYTFETAETKVSRVRTKAKSAGFPLRCTMVFVLGLIRCSSRGFFCCENPLKAVYLQR